VRDARARLIDGPERAKTPKTPHRQRSRCGVFYVPHVSGGEDLQHGE
jgi:hypothetical protein